MAGGERVERLKQAARRRGLRLTPQREVLLRALGDIAHHPTADELFRRVRRSLPGVSPATVYRNAQILVQAGVIATLERAGGPVHYDANLEEHHHFVCTRCGAVRDIYLSAVEYRVNRRRSALAGARIESCEVQLHGRCERCRRAPARAPRPFAARRDDRPRRAARAR